jgi:hypothetical protein
MVVAMRTLRAVPWLLLSGCWVTGPEIDAKAGGDADADTDSDTDADSDVDVDIEVLSVEPAYGSTAGGQVVTVNASPLDGQVSVSFGGEEATVVSIGGDEVVVEVPAGVEGFADVEVTSDTGSGTLTDGFAYWEDAAGRTSAVGEIFWWDYRGGYWGAGADDYGDAWVRLSTPTDLVHADMWAGSTLDRCVTTAEPVGVAWPEGYALGTSLRLVSDSGASISMTRSGDLYSGAMAASDRLAGESWAMELDSVGWPERVDGFLEMPEPLQITEPFVDGADYTEIDYVFSSFTLSWTGGSPGDYVVAQLIRWEGDFDVEYVSCTLRDDGSFNVQSSMFSDWYTGEQLTIIVGRVNVTNATMPTSGGTVEVGAVEYAVGAVWTL